MVLSSPDTTRRVLPTSSSKQPEAKQSSESLCIRFEPALPERSSLRPTCVPVTNRHPSFETPKVFERVANSLNTVKLEDITAQNRPPRWVFNTSPTTGSIKAKAPLLPPPQALQYGSRTIEAGEPSRGNVLNPKTRKLINFSIDIDTHVMDGNPFEDPQSVVDLPDLFPSAEEEDPFADFYSVSSTSTRSENNSEDSQTRPDIDRDPKVHIVEADGDLFSPCASLIPEPDLKEDQAFFIAFEHFNHPDVARQQFRDRQGMLWESAINILMSHYIHPSDLNEDEFVTLVSSQGNHTSDWLQKNSKMIAGRRIRNMMSLHRELTTLGLPPRFLTDEYLEIYQCMQEHEQVEFLNWFKDLKNDVAECEKDIVFSSAAKEKYMGMTFVEKADYIGLDNLRLMKLKHAKTRREESMKLQQIEKELEELIRLAEDNCSSSSGSIDSFGVSLQRMNEHHTYAGDTSTKHFAPSGADVKATPVGSPSKPSRKLDSFKIASELISVVEKFAGDALHTAYEKLHTPRKTIAGPQEQSSEVSRFSYDSGVEVLSDEVSEPNTKKPLSEDSAHGIISKVKSGFFVNRKSHPSRSLKTVESHRDLKRGLRISSFDSDAVELNAGENVSTAREAIVIVPTMVRITPPSTVHLFPGTGRCPMKVDGRDECSEEAPRYSSTATTAVESSTGNHKVQKQKAIAESVSSRSDTSSSSSSGSVRRREFAEVTEKFVKEKQELRPKSSFWTLGRRRTVDLEAGGDIEFAKAFENITHKPKTLRKMFSSLFSIGKAPQVHEAECGMPMDSNDGERPTKSFETRRRLFRRGLPKWEHSA